jgi:hypothetical protein
LGEDEDQEVLGEFQNLVVVALEGLLEIETGELRVGLDRDSLLIS